MGDICHSNHHHGHAPLAHVRPEGHGLSSAETPCCVGGGIHGGCIDSLLGGQMNNVGLAWLVSVQSACLQVVSSQMKLSLVGGLLAQQLSLEDKTVSQAVLYTGLLAVL